jgi:DNA polymerase III subunit delta'
MFKPYPWQEQPWRILTDELSQQRLAHALLLCGDSGLGKADFANAFSAYVLCDSKTQQAACGQCQSCRWLSAGSHPDFYPVTLQEKSKAIKVDQVRQLIQSLDKTSQRGGYQVVVIESADTMNRASANALLKTLEEPLGQVLIMLVADRPSALPATIISRCQSIAFSPASDAQAVAWLKDKITADVDPRLLLKMADYAPLRALHYADLNYCQIRDDLLRHLIRVQRRQLDPIGPAAELMKNELPLLLMILMSMVSDIVRLQQGVSVERIAHFDRLAQMQSLAKYYDGVKLHAYFQSCQKALSMVKSGIHINPQLLLERLLIEYAKLPKKH